MFLNTHITQYSYKQAWDDLSLTCHHNTKDPFDNSFSYHAFCQNHILKMKLSTSFPKCDFKAKIFENHAFFLLNKHKFGFCIFKICLLVSQWNSKQALNSNNNCGFLCGHRSTVTYFYVSAYFIVQSRITQYSYKQAWDDLSGLKKSGRIME